MHYHKSGIQVTSFAVCGRTRSRSSIPVSSSTHKHVLLLAKVTKFVGFCAEISGFDSTTSGFFHRAKFFNTATSY
jgi:hypothetical protein